MGRALEHGNGPDWHWALAPEYDILSLSSRHRRISTFFAHWGCLTDRQYLGPQELLGAVASEVLQIYQAQLKLMEIV